MSGQPAEAGLRTVGQVRKMAVLRRGGIGSTGAEALTLRAFNDRYVVGVGDECLNNSLLWSQSAAQSQLVHDNMQVQRRGGPVVLSGVLALLT